MKTDYRIEFKIFDKANDGILAQGSTFLHNEKRVGEPTFGLENLLEESAETEFWSVLRNFRKTQPEYEHELNKVDCEKCGEETGSKLVGDESYNFCKECNWVTNQ